MTHYVPVVRIPVVDAYPTMPKSIQLRLDEGLVSSALRLAFVETAGTNSLWTMPRRIAYRSANRYIKEALRAMSDGNHKAAGTAINRALNHLHPWRGPVASSVRRQLTTITLKEPWL